MEMTFANQTRPNQKPPRKRGGFFQGDTIMTPPISIRLAWFVTGLFLAGPMISGWFEALNQKLDSPPSDCNLPAVIPAAEHQTNLPGARKRLGAHERDSQDQVNVEPDGNRTRPPANQHGLNSAESRGSVPTAGSHNQSNEAQTTTVQRTSSP